MSVLSKIGEAYCNLPKVLSQYSNDISDVENVVRLSGKKVGYANIENPAWQLYYDQRRVELLTLMKFFDMEVQKVRSRLFKKYKESYNRDLNEREINRYIDNEIDYLNQYELYLEVKELHDKYQAAVDALAARAYALNNITKLQVAALEDNEL